MPVVVLVNVTVAPGTTDPLVSRTVPTTEAESNWASAGRGSKLRSKPSRHTRCRKENRIRSPHMDSGILGILAADCNATANDAQTMPQITAGQIVAFYLFDIAETIDLTAIPGLVGGSAVAARLAPKPATPAYVQYEKPPVSFDGTAVDIPELDGFQVRFRVYDYGVISVALSRNFRGDWSELPALGQSLIENVELEQRAENVCRRAMARIRPALSGLRDA